MAAISDWIISVHDTSDGQTKMFHKVGKDVDVASVIMQMVHIDFTARRLGKMENM